MGVRQEIDAIRDGPGTAAQKRAAILDLVDGYYDQALEPVLDRVFTRNIRVNGQVREATIDLQSVRFVFGPHAGRDFDYVNRLVLENQPLVGAGTYATVIRFVLRVNGTIIRPAADPLIVHNRALYMAHHGSEPNPDYDPQAPRSPTNLPLRQVIAESVIDAIKDEVRDLLRRRHG